MRLKPTSAYHKRPRKQRAGGGRVVGGRAVGGRTETDSDPIDKQFFHTLLVFPVGDNPVRAKWLLPDRRVGSFSVPNHISYNLRSG
jgi:hypothetical protein